MVAQLRSEMTVTWLSFGWTLVIMRVMRHTVGVDVSPEAEEKGLAERESLDRTAPPLGEEGNHSFV